jgi:hypothetical protein
MSVSGLHQGCFLCARLVLCIIHEDLPGHVGERGVQPPCDQDAPVIQPDGHRVRLQGQILRYLFLAPQVLIEVVEEDQVLVVRVTEEVDLRNRLELVIEILVGVAVGELYHGVLQAPDALKHGVDDLGVQADCALLELVEGGVVGTVYPGELLFQALQLRLILWARGFCQRLQLLIQLIKVVLPTLNVLLSLKEEQILFLVMMLDGLRERVLPILEHLYQQHELLIQLAQRGLFRRLKGLKLEGLP